MEVGVSRWGRTTFRGRRESHWLGIPNAGNLRLIEEGNGAGKIHQSASAGDHQAQGVRGKRRACGARTRLSCAQIRSAKNSYSRQLLVEPEAVLRRAAYQGAR